MNSAIDTETVYLFAHDWFTWDYTNEEGDEYLDRTNALSKNKAVCRRHRLPENSPNHFYIEALTGCLSIHNLCVICFQIYCIL